MKKERVIRLRCTEEEYEDWTEQARARQDGLSQWIRDKLNGLDRVMEEVPYAMKVKTPGVRVVANMPMPVATVCNHAGTEIGKVSGVGTCPKCGKMVTVEEVGK